MIKGIDVRTYKQAGFRKDRITVQQTLALNALQGRQDEGIRSSITVS